MPEMNAARRGAGSWVAQGVQAPQRHYTAADLGPLCAAGCGTRVVKALAGKGIDVHPACAPVPVRHG